MVKTKIEWCDYTINPVKGLCPMSCPYCYARAMYKRFKWNPEIRYERFVINPYMKLPPSKIFWGSTIELFHEQTIQFLPRIFHAISILPQHTHVFLTKQPQNLIKWSPYPRNCYVGVTATTLSPFITACNQLKQISSRVKFISFEPLFEQIAEPARHIDEWLIDAGINWLIVGQQTPVREKTQPKIEWIQEIVEAADKAGVAVFLKDNLKSFLPLDIPFYKPIPYSAWDDNFNWELRQEFPK